MSKETEVAQEDDTNSTTTTISMREVDKQTWKDFKKLAAIHELSLPDFLKYVVAKEMTRVQISK